MLIMEMLTHIVWKMRWLLALLSIALGHHALANPVPTARAVLQTEHVEAVIHGGTATVTGSFRFGKVYGRLSASGQVYFPVFCERGTSATASGLEFRAELNGCKALSYSIATNPPLSLAASDSYSIAWILAKFPPQAFDSWQVDVVYEQKLLDGVFYYLPILGEARQSQELFEIRVKADRRIHSIGKAGGVLTKGERELLFIPLNLRPISVSTNPDDAARRFADQQSVTEVTLTNLSWSISTSRPPPLSVPSVEAAERINLQQMQRLFRAWISLTEHPSP